MKYQKLFICLSLIYCFVLIPALLLFNAKPTLFISAGADTQSYEMEFNKDKNKPYMRSLFETSTVAGNERTSHPTQKSLQLMQEIIKIHTNENDTIIDPFMGSGTTGLACLNLNRKFIGIELDKNYFDLTLKRLNRLF